MTDYSKLKQPKFVLPHDEQSLHIEQRKLQKKVLRKPRRIVVDILQSVANGGSEMIIIMFVATMLFLILPVLVSVAIPGEVEEKNATITSALTITFIVIGSFIALVILLGLACLLSYIVERQCNKKITRKITQNAEALAAWVKQVSESALVISVNTIMPVRSKTLEDDETDNNVFLNVSNYDFVTLTPEGTEYSVIFHPQSPNSAWKTKSSVNNSEELLQKIRLLKTQSLNVEQRYVIDRAADDLSVMKKLSPKKFSATIRAEKVALLKQLHAEVDQIAQTILTQEESVWAAHKNYMHSRSNQTSATLFNAKQKASSVND